MSIFVNQNIHINSESPHERSMHGCIESSQLQTKQEDTLIQLV